MREARTVIAVAMLAMASLGHGQQPSAAPVQTQAPVAAGAPPAAGGQVKEATRTAKQKLLDDQAERLVTMANELKAAVDKTNKNILSLDVVRKAEEIESLARRMKDQGKK